jgi:hypothetical protein
MFSIRIDDSLIKSVSLTRISELVPHEQVVVERKNTLKAYLNSLSPEVVISSIIVCNDTNIIIDGHHRYFSLMELGFEKIPVTKIDYSSNNVKAYVDDRISKAEIINSAIRNNLLSPKSSKHVVLNLEDNQWYPIIVLSTIFYLRQ